MLIKRKISKDNVIDIGTDIWVDYINNRRKRGKNFNCFFSGYMRSGKTYSAIALAEKLDPNFSEKKYIFSSEELVRILDEDDYAKELGIKDGESVIVYDETSVSYGAKDSLSLASKTLDNVLSTCGNRKLILFIASPFMNLITKTGRMLLTAEFSTMGIDYNQKISKLKTNLVKYSSRKDKFFYPYLVALNEENQIIYVDEIYIRMASKELLQRCEEKKILFQKALYHKSREVHQALNKKEMFEINKWKGYDPSTNKWNEQQISNPIASSPLAKQLTETQNKFKEYVEAGNSLSDASRHFGFDKSRATQLKRQLFKKGYELTGYKTG